MQSEPSTRRQWIIYSVVRIAIFVGVFALLMLTGLDLWLTGMATAVIGLCISYLFVPQPQRRQKAPKPDVDAEIEDALVDELSEAETQPEAPADGATRSVSPDGPGSEPAGSSEGSEHAGSNSADSNRGGSPSAG